jgi:DNA mismatch repair protein MutS
MAAAFLDLSTGEFLATQFTGDAAWERVVEQIECFGPREIIFPKSLEPLFRRPLKSDADAGAISAEDAASGSNLSGTQFALNPLDEWFFSFDRARELLLSHFDVASLEGFGLAGHDLATAAAGGALHYIRETQKDNAAHITGLSYFEPNDYLTLDQPTVRNLELVEALDGGNRRKRYRHGRAFVETVVAAPFDED